MSDERVSVLVCRGCCCGTVSKHPDVDHAGHLARLRAAVPANRRTKLFTVDCLGYCEHSNVVAVRSGSGRRWFGDILDDSVVEDLAGWLAGGATGDVPVSVARREFDPAPVTAATLRMASWTPDELADMAHRALADAAGGWSMGVHGAAAEFVLDDTRTVTREGRTIEAVTATAAMRLRFTDDCHAFVLDRPGEPDRPLAVVVATLLPAVASAGTAASPSARPCRHVEIRGVDSDAISRAAQHETLVDLGLGRTAASFNVRTADEDLLDLFRSVQGRVWSDASELVGDAVIRHSPTRVVETALGRIEIRTPIPPPGGESPKGSHTHLLPGELDLGLDLPPGITLPNGFVPGVTLFP